MFFIFRDEFGLMLHTNSKFLFCAGKGNTGGDACEAAGQSEVEPVWKTLLQVKLFPEVTDMDCGYTRVLPYFTVPSLLLFVSGCCCFSICCTLWFSHCVVYIAPWRMFQTTTHSQTWTKPSGSKKHSMCVGVTTWLTSFQCDQTVITLLHNTPHMVAPEQTSAQTKSTCMQHVDKKCVVHTVHVSYIVTMMYKMYSNYFDYFTVILDL